MDPCTLLIGLVEQVSEVGGKAAKPSPAVEQRLKKQLCRRSDEWSLRGGSDIPRSQGAVRYQGSEPFWVPGGLLSMRGPITGISSRLAWPPPAGVPLGSISIIIGASKAT